jgi:hypothetical protein
VVVECGGGGLLCSTLIESHNALSAAAAAAALPRRLLDASLAILKEVDPELPNADISPDGKVRHMYTQMQNMHGSSHSKCWV